MKYSTSYTDDHATTQATLCSVTSILKYYMLSRSNTHKQHYHQDRYILDHMVDCQLHQHKDKRHKFFCFHIL